MCIWLSKILDIIWLELCRVVATTAVLSLLWVLNIGVSSIGWLKMCAVNAGTASVFIVLCLGTSYRLIVVLSRCSPLVGTRPFHAP